MTDIASPPIVAKPSKRSLRNRLTSSSLRAYVSVVLDNLGHAGPIPTLESVRRDIAAALQEYEDGIRDKLSLFFEIKALEYRAAWLLCRTAGEYKLFFKTDLQQTPATAAQIDELVCCFLPSDASQPVDDTKAGGLTLIALSYWQQYADSLLKASRRERLLSIFLGVCLALYLSPLLLVGISEVFRGTFLAWFTQNFEVFHYLAFGCAGSVVSMALSVSGVAVMANRPLDDLYLFWSMVPRLLIGALAGVMASNFVFLILPVLRLPGQPEEVRLTVKVLQDFLAFSGGFADRLFLQKLVDATWKMSGLTAAK